MQKLWIFGDSHADIKTNYMEFKDWPLTAFIKQKIDVNQYEHTSAFIENNNSKYKRDCLTYEGWAYWLSKEYDVENYAQCGISGDTCFLRLTNKTDEDIQVNDYKNISVIFILADMINRVPLTGYKVDHQWSFSYHAYSKKEYDHVIGQANTDRNLPVSWEQYHEFAKTFVMDYMETPEYQNRVKLFLGALDHYAGFFKKFICIPVGNYDGSKQGWHKGHKFTNMEFRPDLMLHKMAEQGDMPNILYKKVLTLPHKQGRLKPRMMYPNHLDQKHNRYFYEQIKQWMEKDG